MIPNEVMWGKKDGIFSYRKDIAKSGNRLPTNASLICFHGKHDPWTKSLQKVDWVRIHYPMQQVAA